VFAVINRLLRSVLWASAIFDVVGHSSLAIGGRLYRVIRPLVVFSLLSAPPLSVFGLVHDVIEALFFSLLCIGLARSTPEPGAQAVAIEV
jgi:hypothetical protein